MLIYTLLIEQEKHKRVFEEVYNTYGQELFKLAFEKLNNAYDAEDVLHEAFVSLIRLMNKRDVDAESARVFLIDVVKFRTADRLKDRAKERKMTRSADESALFDKLSLESAESETEETVFQKMLLEALISCMAELPAKYRSVIRLHLIDGLKFSEISGILKIKTENAKKRYQRGRLMLREMLREKGWDVHEES